MKAKVSRTKMSTVRSASKDTHEVAKEIKSHPIREIWFCPFPWKLVPWGMDFDWQNLFCYVSVCNISASANKVSYHWNIISIFIEIYFWVQTRASSLSVISGIKYLLIWNKRLRLLAALWWRKLIKLELELKRYYASRWPCKNPVCSMSIAIWKESNVFDK